jgi:MFS family permease
VSNPTTHGPGGPPAVPVGRYGDRHRPRRRLLVAAAVGAVLLAVAFAGWAALHQGGQVRWQEIAYRVVDAAKRSSPSR